MFLTMNDAKHLQNITTDEPTTQVLLPDGHSIQSTAKGYLPLPAPLTAAPAFIFQDLKRSLISLAEFANQGCEITLTATTITITHKAQIIMQGNKGPTDRLWTLDLDKQSDVPTANHVITHQHDADYVAFWEKSLGCPTIQTLCKAVSRGYLRTIPNLTVKMINANQSVMAETHVGHLNQQRPQKHTLHISIHTTN